MQAAKNKVRWLVIFLLFLYGFVLKDWQVFAQERAFVSVVNPVRGQEFWGQKGSDPLTAVKKQKVIIDAQQLSATWLLRFDAMENSQLLAFFKNFFSNQELGIFLEITPTLAKQAGVTYPQGGVFWHDANKIFLSGYQPGDREKLISLVFETFFKIFGYYPKSVGAWHVDAYSARLMKEKYGITGVLICADQFGTDGYQIWGGWWGVPYYPSLYNILLPAQTLENKIDLVVFWWAARDPEKGYGGSVEESTYSLQANDIEKHNLGTDYFNNLVDTYLKSKNQFGQLTIGLENDLNWGENGDSYKLQIEEVGERREKGEIKVDTMDQFSTWYRQNFPKLSPSHQIKNWLMSTNLRAGFIKKNGKNYLNDLRVYNENWPEANLLTANPWETLSLNNPYLIDSVRFPDKIQEVTSFSVEALEKQFPKLKMPFQININFLCLFYSLILAILIILTRKNLKLFFLIVVGSLSLILPMVKSGLIYPYGMGFWGPNGHDGIWHLALINQLSKFSLENPVFSGITIFNYHLGYDFLVAVIYRLTGISPVNLYFQIIPPVLAILLGIFTYNFVKNWTGSKISAFLATFFVYFGGSWGWLVTLIRDKSYGGESLFWANQAVSSQINPPYMLSLVLIVAGLGLLVQNLKNPQNKRTLLLIIIFGILLPIKVYAGIIVLGSLLGVTVVEWLLKRSRKEETLKTFILSLVVSLVLFLPFNLKAGSLLIFSVLWFPRTMLIFQDRFYWPILANARQAYQATGQWLKWFLAESLGLAIFLIGNLGIRVIALPVFIDWGRKFKKLTQIESFIIFSLLISLVFPLFFIQKGNPWNTIQFFYYFQFFLGILAGITLGKWAYPLSSKGTSRWIVILILMLLTLPTSASTLKNDYLPPRPPARISFEELEALDFLKDQKDGRVLSYPFDQTWRGKFSEPRPLYAYETTAYVSALSRKPSFLSDEMNLEISGYPWQARREASIDFFKTNDKKQASNFLGQNKIKYIYLVKGQKMNLGEDDLKAQKIFENGEVRIFEVKW